MSALSMPILRTRSRNKSLVSMRLINFSDLGLNDITLVNKLADIEVISFNNNLLTSLNYFKGNPYIQELHLKNNLIKDIGELKVLKILKELKVLSVEGNPFLKNLKEPYRIAVLRILPKLEKIDGVAVTAEERKKAKEEPSPVLEETPVKQEEIKNKENIAEEQKNESNIQVEVEDSTKKEKSPDEKSPDENLPNEKSSEENQANQKTSDESQPKENLSDEKPLEKNQPNEISSDEKSSDENPSNGKTSDETQSSEKSSNEKSPDEMSSTCVVCKLEDFSDASFEKELSIVNALVEEKLKNVCNETGVLLTLARTICQQLDYESLIALERTVRLNIQSHLIKKN